MSRTNDKNLFSIVGKHDRTITLKLPAPGEWVDVPADMGGFSGVFNPLDWDDVLKITVIVEGVLHGGREDCVDINNRCRNVAVIAPDGLCPYGLHVVTAKGGSQGVRIEGPLLARSQEDEFNLGGWSDQSNKPSSDIELLVSVSAMLGRPRVRKLNARAIRWNDRRIKRARLWLPDWLGPIVMKVWSWFR